MTPSVAHVADQGVVLAPEPHDRRGRRRADAVDRELVDARARSRSPPASRTSCRPRQRARSKPSTLAPDGGGGSGASGNGRPGSAGCGASSTTGWLRHASCSTRRQRAARRTGTAAEVSRTRRSSSDSCSWHSTELRRARPGQIGSPTPRTGPRWAATNSRQKGMIRAGLRSISATRRERVAERVRSGASVSGARRLAPAGPSQTLDGCTAGCRRAARRCPSYRERLVLNSSRCLGFATTARIASSSGPSSSPFSR